MILKYHKTDLNEITVDLIKKVINEAQTQGHNRYAPLGCSGDDYFLFGESRRRQISLRLYSGDVELLVTDNAGGFLFYGRFDNAHLPISFIAEQYFNIIQNVKYLLDNTYKKSSITEDDKEKMFERAKTFNRFYPGVL